MPNWCDNTLTLTHEDSSQIVRAVGAFKRGEFLAELVPNPDKEWAYDWCVSNWGTKWDVGDDDAWCMISADGQAATFGFSSAWAPPIAAYESMLHDGFGVDAMYYEPGECYVGRWQDGKDDYYEYSKETSVTVRDIIGAELDDEFGVSCAMADYEAENPEEEPLTQWYQAGVADKGLT